MGKANLTFPGRNQQTGRMQIIIQQFAGLFRCHASGASALMQISFDKPQESGISPNYAALIGIVAFALPIGTARLAFERDTPQHSALFLCRPGFQFIAFGAVFKLPMTFLAIQV